MRISSLIFLFSASIVLLASHSTAEILQSRGQGGSLWMVRDGAEIRVGRIGGEEIRVALPPGATLRDLEPTAAGWLAAGRHPAGRGTDLLLVEGRESGADLLPVPERVGGRYRGQPVLMMENQRLVGLAWAEGDGPRELEIWASIWQGGEWGPSELVSPKGPGSQVAPVGAVLEDGTWLLMWAAYDGEDDEILASRRLNGRWTRPEPIHSANDVPDLSPDLVPIDGGALAVWSWYDGNDYRLKSARWQGGSWREGQAFGAKGSGEPGLMRLESGALLLYPSVEPASWTVLEMDRAGLERRIAVVLEEKNERPLLILEGAAGEILRWPSEDRTLEWRDLP